MFGSIDLFYILLDLGEVVFCFLRLRLCIRATVQVTPLSCTASSTAKVAAWQGLVPNFPCELRNPFAVVAPL